jgi:hypothetical protein
VQLETEPGRAANALVTDWKKQRYPSATRIYLLLSIHNVRQLGRFLIEAVGERNSFPTSTLEGGAFRAPGRQGADENRPLSALFANENDAP